MAVGYRPPGRCGSVAPPSNQVLRGMSSGLRRISRAAFRARARMREAVLAEHGLNAAEVSVPGFVAKPIGKAAALQNRRTASA